MGRYNTPSYSNGWLSLDGVTFVGSTANSGASAATAGNYDNMDADGDVFYMSFDGQTTGRTGSFLNKYDMVRFQSGATALVLEDPVADVVRAAANGGTLTAATDSVVKLK